MQHIDRLLHEQGILYLFYDAYELPWGFEEDEGCYKVLYFDEEIHELKRRSFPRESEDYYPLDAFKVSYCSVNNSTKLLLLCNVLINLGVDFHCRRTLSVTINDLRNNMHL